MMNKAIFSDLDGTLIRVKSGNKFPKDIDDWELKTDVLNALYTYMSNNLIGLICIVTNQGGVQAGYWTVEEINSKLENIVKSIKEYYLSNFNYRIDIDYGVSYTINKNDFNRKPNPGMGYKLALRNNLFLSRCIMIGDADGTKDAHSSDDIEFANNCVMNFLSVDNFVNIYSNNFYITPNLF